MKQTFIVLLLAVMFCMGSCQSLFEVEPKTEVSEETLFSRDLGFYRALTGVYLQATESNNYGGTLSYVLPDVLANNYTVGSSPTSSNALFEQFNYTSVTTERQIAGIWSRLYQLIANCNNILKNLDGKQSLFPSGNYEIMVAETRAMRAMLHFDLLRYFGPVPSVNMTKIAIPYVDRISKIPVPPSTTENVLKRIIEDLEIAQNLLKDHDPLFIDSPLLIASEDPAFVTANGFRRDRGTRLNYYSVTGLLARIYLYSGNTTKAYENARIIFEEIYNVGLLTDYQWSSTILTGFNINGTKLRNYTGVYFSQSAYENKLQITTSQQQLIYATLNDKRIIKNYGTREGETISNIRIFNAITCYVVMRSTEAYLILAETAPTTDEALSYLNMIRTYCGVPPLTNTPDLNLETEIRNEYRRETLGEGQMFTYLKRKNLATFQGGNIKTIQGMTNEKYTFPIPVQEQEFNDYTSGQ